MTREQYVKETKAKLEDWDAKVDSLSRTFDEAKTEAQRRLKQRVRALRVKRDEAKVKVEQLKGLPRETWRDFQGGIERVLDELETTAERTEQALEEEGVTKS